MRAALLLAILLPLTPAFADETGRPTGENCNLAAPPDSAGEEVERGLTLRVFPRGRDIGSKYSGCQLRWAPVKDHWYLVAITGIASGEPVRLWSPEVSVVTCLYDKGKLVQGEVRNCPDAQNLILRSRAPGCLEKIRHAVGQGGNASAHVPGCEPE